MRPLKINSVVTFIACLISLSISIPGFTWFDENQKSSHQNRPLNLKAQDKLILAQGGMHHGMGQGHMRQGCGPDGMGHGPGGMGCGRHGDGHHRGMGPGGNYGERDEVSAQCPQSRSTEKAPEPLFSSVNPLEKNSDNIEKGRLLFMLDAQPSCTACHGPNGDGLGMMGGALTPPPRNFTCSETMKKIPDGQLFWIIQNGSAGTGMPAFNYLADEEIWSLILFLRTFSN
ncbi:MAG: c-type cytochrome [Nitrospinales bacterium]